MAERKLPKQPLDHEPEAVTWAREKAGLTRAAVAEAMGCSPSLVTEVEQGTRNLTPANIIKLAGILNCPVVVLERKRQPEAPVAVRLPKAPAEAEGAEAALCAPTSPARGRRQGAAG